MDRGAVSDAHTTVCRLVVQIMFRQLPNYERTRAIVLFMFIIDHVAFADVVIQGWKSSRSIELIYPVSQVDSNANSSFFTRFPNRLQKVRAQNSKDMPKRLESSQILPRDPSVFHLQRSIYIVVLRAEFHNAASFLLDTIVSRGSKNKLTSQKLRSIKGAIMHAVAML